MRLKNIVPWMVPPLVALVLYWPGLMAWFQKDDFVWLGLYPSIHNWDDFLRAMFARPGHGTLRVFSERVFFTVFYGLFGLHALPYRIFCFLTFAADTVLLAAVCGRLTGSRAAGFWAALLWTVNGVLAYELSWTVVYNQLACAFIFLLALWLLIEGRYAAQWMVYLIGFGMLEINVLYPALALAWALAFAPRTIRRVLPMFVPAILYVAIQFATAPPVHAGPYQMHFDASIFSTLATYWKIALGPSRLFLLGIYPSFGRSLLTVLMTAGLLGFLICDVARRRWTTAFFAAWFVIVLGPLLLLRNQIQDYYLTVALLGLAMWGAWGIVRAWNSGGAGRVAAVLLPLIYIAVALPLAHHVTTDFYVRSMRVKRAVEAIVADQRRSPSEAVLLDNVNRDLYIDAFSGRPLRLYGIDRVYILPRNRAAIGPDAMLPGFDPLFGDHPGGRVYDVGALTSDSAQSARP